MGKTKCIQFTASTHQSNVRYVSSVFTQRQKSMLPLPAWTYAKTTPKTEASELFLNISRFHSLSLLFIVIPERHSGTHPLCCAADRWVTILCALQMCVHILFKFHLKVFCTLADQIIAFSFKVVQTVFKTSNFFHHCLQKWNKHRVLIIPSLVFK